jgi:hypothetical protein
MFSSNPWNWLALVAGGFVLVGYSSADAGLLPAEAMTNTCPAITQVVASPLKASVGGDIDVSVTAVDQDGDSINYLWTGTGGSFADPAARTTTYRCEEGGNQSITITVSDAESCTVTWTAQVACLG